MVYIQGLLLILAGIIAASSLIIAKKPEAAALIKKITPYQAFYGIALLIWSTWWWLHDIGFLTLFRGLNHGLAGITLVVGIIEGVLLGFFFGMPQIAAWIPGESNAEAKAVALSKKLAPYQVMLGLVGIVAGILRTYYAIKG